MTALTPDALANLLNPESGQVDAGLMKSISPIDGSIVDLADVDQLADALELVKECYDRLRPWNEKIKQALCDLRDGNQKTQRVKGQRRLVKIVEPPDKQEQGQLKEVWNSYPQLRDELLQIDRLKIRLREFKKAATVTDGPADYMNFVKMISQAVQPATASPTVTIEK